MDHIESREFLNHNFFNLFHYEGMEHDVIDYATVYSNIRILRDLTTAGGITLSKGDSFEQVTFDMLRTTFSFIIWDSVENAIDGVTQPKVEIVIPQAQLAPFLKWQ